MRDICADLRDRAQSVAQQISAEDARFESLVSQLKTEQDSKLKHLRAQLRLANRLLEFTAWHDRERAQLVAGITVAEAAENFIKKSFRTAAEHTIDRGSD
jgi:hypothetical protein